VTNLVQFSGPIAWFDHLVLIVLLSLAYMRLDDRRWSDALRMLAALAGTFLYFATIIALTWPRSFLVYGRILVFDLFSPPGSRSRWWGR
jgi:uncharacterized membrane protein YdjX (TVP38/TMEM64 family)